MTFYGISENIIKVVKKLHNSFNSFKNDCIKTLKSNTLMFDLKIVKTSKMNFGCPESFRKH